MEILTDKPPHYSKDCQTDFEMEKPNLRLYMPKKTGIDIETQIEDGEIFDFDYEVDPVLNVISNYTLILLIFIWIKMIQLGFMQQNVTN